MTQYSRKFRIPFHEVVDKATQNLLQQGFNVVTTIDLQEIFRGRLKVGFRNYKILGACNPEFAYQAVSLESHMGTMLPCNIVIQEHENGEVEVSAVNPLENIDMAHNTTILTTLGTEVGIRLRAALDYIQRNSAYERSDALPEETVYTSPSILG